MTGFSTSRAPLRRASPTASSLASLLLAFVLTAFATACGGAPDHPPSDTVATDSNSPTNAPPVGTPAPSDSQGRVALGGDIFNGRVAGGMCFTCHGQNGAGTTLAPSLGDQTWIHGDGSIEFVANLIRMGIPNPKQYPSPMPSFAAMFTDQQIQAIAAYVYSLSRGGP